MILFFLLKICHKDYIFDGFQSLVCKWFHFGLHFFQTKFPCSTTTKSLSGCFTIFKVLKRIFKCLYFKDIVKLF